MDIYCQVHGLVTVTFSAAWLRLTATLLMLEQPVWRVLAISFATIVRERSWFVRVAVNMHENYHV